jgi:uncharacterized membrane protein YhhN
MNTHPRLAAFLYFVFAFLHCAFIQFSFDELRALTKILLMPALALYAFSYFKLNPLDFEPKRFWFLVTILFFSWLGDIFLLWDEAFIPGLGSFLIAQLGYTFVFLRLRNRGVNSSAFFARRLFWALAFLFFGGAFFRLLYPALLGTDFLLPVGLYTLAITSMGLSTSIRNGSTSSTSYLTGILGAILFILSDAMIAISVFLEPFPYHNLLVMLTYISAQFLLVIAILKHRAY